MNGNAAYDLSRFEEKQKRPAVEVLEPKKSPRKRKILGMSPAKAIMMLVVVGVLASVLIYNRVLIIEANEEIRQANNQMTILESEGTRLDMELEGKTSLKNIEDYATQNLGMQKMEKQQVQYVSLSEEEKVVLSKDMVKPNIFQRISGWFQNLMEYLR